MGMRTWAILAAIGLAIAGLLWWSVDIEGQYARDQSLPSEAYALAADQFGQPAAEMNPELWDRSAEAVHAKTYCGSIGQEGARARFIYEAAHRKMMLEPFYDRTTAYSKWPEADLEQWVAFNKRFSECAEDIYHPL